MGIGERHVAKSHWQPPFLLRYALSCLLLLVTMSISAQVANAATYRVSVTRVAQDAYREESSRSVILTANCYQYVYWQNAVLVYEPNAMGNRLHFSGSSSCSVMGVYGANASLARVGNNLYRDTRSGRILRTQLCLSLALGEDALITSDRVIFLGSSDECDLAW
jgi:hypothetical protein